MKKLILVRHAKSSWNHDVTDHERPLKTRGIKDANLVSKSLRSHNLSMELIISSDAVRTKSTAKIFIKNLSINEDNLQFSYDLYDFSGENLIRFIKTCDSTINNLMIFGHNHAITAFVNTFGTEYIDNVPTSGVVIIEFDIEKWRKLKPGKTIITLFPRDIKP
ncbi:histidine phosphatase family protein [uncultured Algibacter sp.]|uniref:SixA phosphatase family protein n=1 Tax=uncultured Algibacter sp. TaxID=298659 RepID=UPI002639D3BC|nr:histidine phosphatase family protein [uncultured Algibacter sp.]